MPTLRDPDPSPGAVIAIQTFGDFLNFNPYCHVLCTDGVFYGSEWFKVAPDMDTGPLEEMFQHKVLKMLMRNGKITEEVVKLILSWRHSGFNVHCGARIRPKDDEAMASGSESLRLGEKISPDISSVPPSSRRG
jgi:hypothetical protein